jgi:hypothetical protein
MDNDKFIYYEKILKETLGYELYPWQTKLLKQIIKNPNLKYYISSGRHNQKILLYKTLSKIQKELTGENL